MIQIKPNIQHDSNCPYCSNKLENKRILWQGIHVCVITKCENCQIEVIEDLKVGQAFFTPYQVVLSKEQLFCINEEAKLWFGQPLYESLKHPCNDISIKLKVEKFSDYPLKSL